MDKVRSIFTDTSQLSVSIASVMVAFHLLGHFYPFFVSVVALAPAYTMGVQHYFVWNIFTAAFYEQNPMIVLLNILAVLAFGHFSKSHWSQTETLKFYVVVNIITGVSAFASYIFLYAVKHDEAYLFQPAFGFYGIIGAYSVVLKQLCPELEILYFPLKYIPTLYACVFLLLPQYLPIGTNMIFGIFGTFYGWFYLRFYQKHDNGSPRGDQNDHFGFHTFFPSFIQPPIMAVCKLLYRFFGCLTRFEESVQANSPNLFYTPLRPLPGSDPVESERRRQLAMKVMEERLGAAPNSFTDVQPASSV